VCLQFRKTEREAVGRGDGRNELEGPSKGGLRKTRPHRHKKSIRWSGTEGGEEKGVKARRDDEE